MSADPATAMADRHYEQTGNCDGCTEELPRDDFLLNENGQFCDEACETDFLAAPKTLTDVAKRDFGLRECGGRI